MKRIIFLSIVSMFTVAQTNAQITFGIKGGLSLANQQFKGSDAISDENAKALNDSKKFLPAFHAGVTADIPLTENLVLQPALQFAQKGFKSESEFTINNLTFKTTGKGVLNYLELPVNLLYRQSSEGGFYGGVGPYVGYALSGKSTSKTNDEPEEKDDVDFDEDGIKRLDAGANFMIGYELPMGVTIGANYSLGLTNINETKENDGLSAKNSYIGISIGYKFRK